MPERPYRVVQWATGVLGRSVIRGLIERAEFEPVGALVFDPRKAGADIGTLAGSTPCGVTATDDRDKIMKLDADCVVYAPLPSAVFSGDPAGDVRTICDLLASGKNVVSLLGLIYPPALGPAWVRPLESACRTGGTSVHGTGVSNGFLTDLLPLVLSGLTRRISHVYIRECSDFAGHPSRRLVTDLVGLGRLEEDYQRAMRPYRSLMASTYTESIHLVGRGLGLPIEEVETHHDYLLAADDFTVRSGTVVAGSVAAARWTFTGIADKRPVVTMEVVHKADARRVEDWCAPGYALRIDGQPAIALSGEADWVTSGVSAAAAHTLNTIPPLCEAPPGIRTLLDLPLITGRA